MTTTAARLFELAIKQIASETFLTRNGDPQIGVDDLELSRRLRFGNGHVSKLLGPQADEFLSRYEILAQRRNDPLDPTGTGFSGTLIRDRFSGELTLSFRSTEFIEDAVRDSKATNEWEVKELGWALGQISEMEAWYRSLRADPRYLQGREFHVTGYSLGGHLATAFNLLRREEAAAGVAANPILGTVTFNGAGVGGLPAGTTLGAMLATFDRLRTVPDIEATADWSALSPALKFQISNRAASRVASIQSEYARLQDIDAQFAFGARPPLGDQATLGYQKAALFAARDAIPVSRAPFAFGGTNWVPTAPVFAADRIAGMREVVGSDGGRLGPSFVANSGVHYGARAEAYIEDQPLTRGTYSLLLHQGSMTSRPDVNDFADTHSLLLLVDSLALLAVFERLDPAFTLEAGARILAAASAAAADSQFGAQGRAEGDTLERTLDALAKLVLGPDTPPVLADYAPTLAGNTWHADEFRVPFHRRLAEVHEGIDRMGASGAVTFVAVDGLEAGAIAQRAKAEGAQGEAYRYALRELNPFVAVGLSYAAQGPLGLDPAGATGMTEAWVDARAEMLVAMARHFRSNGHAPTAGHGFLDLERGLRLGRASSLVEQVVFGAARDDAIAGGAMDDRLFGGAGNDVLAGGFGHDRLEGGGGDDRLEGGPGDDRLLGGAGDDTYVIAAGDGRDTILDADGTGRVQYLGRGLAGGDAVAPDRFVDAAGTRYLLLDRGDGSRSLLVDGVLEIEDFESGDLGIVLRTPGAATPDPPVGSPDYLDTRYPVGMPQGEGDARFVAAGASGSDAADRIVWTHGGSVLARAGSDRVEVSGEGPVFVIGGAGDDHLDASAALPTGEPVVAGGAGNDTIVGSARADTLLGDNWRVSVGNAAAPFAARIDGFAWDLAYAARDYPQIDAAEVTLLSQAGGYGDVALRIAEAARAFADVPVWSRALDVVRDEGWIFPDGLDAVVAYVQGPAPSFDDEIDGGGGDDAMYGGSGSDVLHGGDGNDRIEGDFGEWALFAGVAPDVLARIEAAFGEPGDDVLYGDAGDDVLIDASGGFDELHGGDGNDTLVSIDREGEAAFNLLDGGAGDDVLTASGDPGGYDVLLGGAGNDLLETNRAGHLEGGFGDDRYRAYSGTLFDLGGDDRLDGAGIWLPTGVSADEIQATFGGIDIYDTFEAIVLAREGADLVYDERWVADEPGEEHYEFARQLVFEDWFAPGEHRIEWVDAWSADVLEQPRSRHTGAREAIEVAGGEGVDTMFGSAADDVLEAAGGNDRLAGRRGNDVLDGGAGDDDYFFGRGHGHDLVFDAAGRDTLRLAPGLAAGDVSLAFSEAGLRIDIADGSVTLAGIGPGVRPDDLPLERILFADGTSVDLSAAIAQLPIPEGPSMGGGSDTPPAPIADPPAAPADSAPPSGPTAAAASATAAEALAPGLRSAPAQAAAADAAAAAGDPPVAPAMRVAAIPLPDRADAGPSEAMARAADAAPARPGEPADPVYRGIDARLDVLLQAGRAGFSERYAQAIADFNQRAPVAESPAQTPSEAPPPPLPSDDELARAEAAMHAWHAAHPAFDGAWTGAADGVWLAGWSALAAGASSLDARIAPGEGGSLVGLGSNPSAIRLQGVRPAPALHEGLAELGA